MAASVSQDSPLSLTSNIVGILTFVVAIAAATYARVTYLRHSDDEYFRVKASLSWYKTESTWLADLLEALSTPDAQRPGEKAHPTPARRKEHQMYAFVMDDLLNLEQRLLDVVTEVEARAETEDKGARAGAAARGTDGQGAVPAHEHDFVAAEGPRDQGRMGRVAEGQRVAG
ncbi:hypothetical protein HIM_05439 [Hirsutella minnesotensis 3608]|uniref:Uncharacterized protein n=1 Tax=Hirsutella minnesotensis 3608 TaxID=1043627 RepID=A0A0F7ZPC2_9HYPO|nr:hypothetical protein HIM_05439 [Hirsutella minnesotensis 3608]